VKHIYKDNFKKYLHEGINVIPDRYAAKTPLIKGWNDYCEKPVSHDQADAWCNQFSETNIAIPLGNQNNLCVIDVDTTDARLLEFLDKNLPPSPVTRLGAKGFVRFYRSYPSLQNYILKDCNNNVVMEMFARNKKITIAPSVHPSGCLYKWKDRSLLEVIKEDENALPILPPFLLPNLELLLRREFPDQFGQYSINKIGTADSFKIVNGRTDALKKKCFELLSYMDKGKVNDISKIVEDLVEYDLVNHKENPLFTDLNEQSQLHTHARTNALKFVVSMIDYVQGKRFKDNKNYMSILNGSFRSDEEKSKFMEILLDYRYRKVRLYHLSKDIKYHRSSLKDLERCPEENKDFQWENAFHRRKLISARNEYRVVLAFHISEKRKYGLEKHLKYLKENYDFE